MIWNIVSECGDIGDYDSFGLNPVVAQILRARGFNTEEEVRDFLEPQLSKLHSPFLFNDMEKVLARLERALKNNEKILVHGDFDADGITGTVLLVTTLRRAGFSTDFFIPDRFRDGYGFEKAGISAALDCGASLVVTVDCGITAVETTAEASFKGLDVIITDHHLPAPGKLPEAQAILNPAVEGSGYPEKRISGAVVALKLCEAIVEYFGLSLSVESLLKVAAIGTVADIVPLTGENRVVVTFGLKGLSEPRGIGLKALLRVCGLEGKTITAGDIGFKIGPRLNASGRMGSAGTAVELFLSGSHGEASRLAGMLEKANLERQKVQKLLLDKILAQIEVGEDSNSIVVWGKGWHRGILGLAAQRLKDKYYKPSIVINVEEGRCRGSCRGVDGMNLVEILEECKEFLLRFGGHNYAAGLELRETDLEAFSNKFDAVISGKVAGEPMEEILKIDCAVKLKDMTFDFLSELDRLEPFGMGNPRPLFSAHAVRVSGDFKVMKKKHLSFQVEQNGEKRRAIYWGGAEYADEIANAGQIVFTLRKDSFGGKENVYLDIRDFK